MSDILVASGQINMDIFIFVTATKTSHLYIWVLETLIGKLSLILMDFYHYFHMATSVYMTYSVNFLWSLSW